VISKTHARDFPAISAARTLPLCEYRSPSGIEWSPVAMEIEIYGRTDGARLAAHGIQGCRVSTVETYSSGFEPCVRSSCTQCCLHGCGCISRRVSIARVFTTESSKNDFFFSLLITYAIRKPRRLRAAHNVYTESKDVIWKIGSSNRIISFNSCLDKSPAAADTVRDRFLSSILIPNISARVATIKRISNFRVGSTGKQASEFSCYSLCK